MISLEQIGSVKAYLLKLQSELCAQLSEEDGQATFVVDDWERSEGGGGSTRVLTDGGVIEQGGVNFSHIFGSSLPASGNDSLQPLQGYAFQAMGVSAVIHPHNPYVPTAHANVRFFVAEKKNCPTVWWFGGGFDLTPFYPFKEDCIHWHQIAKQACDPFGEAVYPRLKAWADRYFYLTHRQEPRGIGGLFFDNWNEGSFEQSFSFMQSIGNHFIQAYRPIMTKRKPLAYGEAERWFQCYRRGRYVEFNLVHDRGTLFGLQSNGRIESILMSLPPNVKWHYNWHPEENSAEAQLQSFLQPREWVDFTLV